MTNKKIKKILLSAILTGSTIFFPRQGLSDDRNRDVSSQVSYIEPKTYTDFERYINNIPKEPRKVFENVWVMGVGSGTQSHEDIIKSTRHRYDLIVQTGFPNIQAGHFKDTLDATFIDAQVKDKESYLNSTAGKLFGKLVETYGPCEFKNVTGYSRGAYLLDLEKEYGGERIKIGNFIAVGPSAWGGEIRSADQIIAHPQDPIPKITVLHPEISVTPQEQRITLSYHRSFDSPTEIPGIIAEGITAPLKLADGLLSIPKGSLSHHASDQYGITGPSLNTKIFGNTVIAGRDSQGFSLREYNLPDIQKLMPRTDNLNNLYTMPPNYIGHTANLSVNNNPTTIPVAPPDFWKNNRTTTLDNIVTNNFRHNNLQSKIPQPPITPKIPNNLSGLGKSSTYKMPPNYIGHTAKISVNNKPTTIPVAPPNYYKGHSKF